MIIGIIFLLYLNDEKEYRFRNSLKERFWIIRYDKKKKNDFYSYKIMNNILTHLDDKINLFLLLKNKKYIPYTFVINLDDIMEIPKDEPNSLWFIKHRSTGGGVYVFPIFYKNIIHFFDNNKKLKRDPKIDFPEYYPKRKYLLQKGINPYIINNFKNDIRIFYIIILYKNKLNFYISRDGLVKFSQTKYDKYSIDKEIQITNTARCKKDLKNNMSCKNQLLSSLEEYRIMYKRIKEMFKDLSYEIRSRFLNNYDSRFVLEYQVCGVDVIFDRRLNPYLLELNSKSPAYIKDEDSIEIKILKYNIKEILKETLGNSLRNETLKIDGCDLFEKL